jgi:hypothetical protein
LVLTLNIKFWEELIAFSFDMTRTAQKMMPPTIHCCGKVFSKVLPSNSRGTYAHMHTHTSNSSSIVACIPCCGNMFTEQLPNNERRDTHTDIQTDVRN